MKKLFILILSMCAMHVNAQNDNVFTYGNSAVSKSEFESVYKKNNIGKSADYSEKSLRDYLNLYENFKIKVAEAKQRKFDTIPSLKAELAQYRKQLAKSYLYDKATQERLYKEAYDRSKTDVHVMHILVKCSADAFAADSMKAKEKIQEIYNRVVVKGEDFSTVAREVSEDPGSKLNGGDLGWMTALQTFYPFETAAYTTGVDKVSKPFRTKVGYHIIRVLGTRPNPGQFQVEHILVSLLKGASPAQTDLQRATANRMYNRLKSGAVNFETLAKDSSDDKVSAKDGGKLAMFTTGRMVPEFEQAVFDMKEIGSITGPVQSEYGYHIIKLLDRKPNGTYEEMKDDIKKRVDADTRIELARANFVSGVKKEYGFTENQTNLNTFVQSFTDSALFKAMYKASMCKSKLPLCSFSGTTYTTQDFAKYLEQAQRYLLKHYNNSMEIALNAYPVWIDRLIVDYTELHLGDKHPEFKALIDEYQDGILLFEITDREVWTRAVSDSAGLKKFYETEGSGKYLWKQRLNATIYKCANGGIADDVWAILNKTIPDSDDAIKEKFNTPEKKNNVFIESNKYERGMNPIIDKANWVPGLQRQVKDGTNYIIRVAEVMSPSPKTLDEARGYAIADYQEYLEKNWIQSLRNKYPVKENETVFQTLIKK